MRENLVFVIGTLVLASPAAADHTSVHATADGEVGTTDNLFAGSERRPDMFYSLRPGLLYAYDAPQMIHDFSAQAEAIGSVRGEEPFLTGRAGWKGLFLWGPRTQMNLTINAGTGLLSMLSARSSPDETTVGVTPSGRIEVQQADTAQSLSWISGKHTRISQGVVGRYGFTDDGAGTETEAREAGANLGFERTFRKDSIAVDASVSYLKLERIAPVGARLGSRFDRQLNPRGVLAWRHEIDKQWSTNADGGIVFMNPIGTDKYNPARLRRSGTFGVFGAHVAYNEPWGRAVLSGRRNVVPNLFLAQNTLEDSANFQLAMPLPWLQSSMRRPRLVALGSAGVAHTQLINAETGAAEGDFTVARVDFSVGWTPKPGQTYGMRYELAYQTGDPMAVMTIPAYLRNTLFVTFSLRYPARVAGDVPKRLKSMRSDRKDMLPVGDFAMPDVFGESMDDGR